MKTPEGFRRMSPERVAESIQGSPQRSNHSPQRSNHSPHRSNHGSPHRSTHGSPQPSPQGSLDGRMPSDFLEQRLITEEEDNDLVFHYSKALNQVLMTFCFLQFLLFLGHSINDTHENTSTEVS